MTTAIATDLITPLGAYLRLRNGGSGSFLLESVEQGRLGRYSFIGAGTRLVDLDEAEALALPVVGFVSCDDVVRLEPLVPLPDDGPGLPESRFIVAGTLVRFDHVLGVAEVLRGDAGALEGPLPPVPRGDGRRGPLRRFPEQAEHERRVRKAKEYIRTGDAFQIVVAQRAERNPIAGSIAPGEGDAEALLRSEKDRAEHVMLVDLGRNDLSRVCRPGTVRVERFLEPERFSHVTHLVSEVAGELSAGTGAFDLLRACFPAGTVSGAPKVRAMQIISELEGYRRGPYAGAV